MKTKQSLEEILSKYRPQPGAQFYQRMAKAPWAIKENPLIRSVPSRPARFGWQIAVAIIIVIALIAFSIPPVRASISAWLGLSVAPANQMPAASITLVPITLPAPTSTPAEASTATRAPTAEATQPEPTVNPANPDRPPEVKQIDAQAGWSILVASNLPKGYIYQSAYFDTNHQMVILTYLVTRPLPGATDPSLTESKSITLLQAQKNDFVPMQIAPATHVEDIQINGAPAAYAVGAWDAEFVKDAIDPNGGKMVYTWRSDLAVQNLYWQVGKLYLCLVTDDGAVSQAELIKMAESVQP